MKKMKKFFAVILSLAMVLGMSITAMAASNKGSDGLFGTKDDTATITVSGIDYESNVQVKAYKVVEAKYDGAGNTFSGYNSLYPDVISQDMVKTDLTTLTPAELTDLATAVTNAKATADYTLTNVGNTSNWIADVSAGTYLILVTGTEAHSYNPMVVSAYYVNKDGKTDISEGVVNLTTTGATAKKADEPNLDKTITNATNNTANKKGNSAEVGDTVSYSVSVDPIPNYTGNYPVFNVEDTLSNGLAFKTEKVNGTNTIVKPVVQILNAEGNLVETLTENVDYIVNYTDNNKKMTVDFVSHHVTGDGEVSADGTYTLSGYAGQKLVITYDAVVTDAAVVAPADNENNAKLNFTKDSKTNGNDKSVESKTYTYTFDIDGNASGTKDILKKTEKVNGEEVALKDATFGLYRATDGVDAKAVEQLDEDAAYKTAISDKDGQLYFSQLKEGTYYLKELTAPDGYSVNTHVYTVVIAATYKTDGQLDTWTVTIDGTKTTTFTSTSVADGAYDVTPDTTGIVNTKLNSLPSTGGIGTTIFTIAGCAIMIAAAGFFFASRKKANR